MALNLFSRLMPAEADFTPLFCEQAKRIREAAEELRQMIVEDIPAEQHVATDPDARALGLHEEVVVELRAVADLDPRRWDGDLDVAVTREIER